MRMLSAAQRKSLERAVSRYEQTLPEASGYLSGRGIGFDVARRWRLGVVRSPEIGHEHLVGRLCIPYQDEVGVVGVKFRCLVDHHCKTAGCQKYMAPLGQEVRIFNVLATETTSSLLHICEGELDTIVLESVLGQPVVGIPGSQDWEPHWPAHFHGFDRVLLWRDGDRAGRDMARRLQREIHGLEIVPVPETHDVCSLHLTQGADAIRALAGLESGSMEDAPCA